MGAEEEAWVTLATNDTYALGALVLAHSIRSAGTSRRLVALVTPGVTMAMRDQLSATFDLVQMVNVLDSGDTANLALLSRPDLGVTFTKLHCWRLTQFSKCVFLDADTLMLHPCDELFDREELSAAPDAGWPDCFNSGVFVFRPSLETYQKLLAFAVSHGSFDGGDQGLLNSFFSDWATKDISRHLPFIYNMCSTATYSYLPAYKKFGETVRIAHFIGATKPWLQPFDSETRKVRVSADQEHQRMLLQIWWDIFCYHVHPHLSIDMGGLASAFSKMVLDAPKSDEQRALEDHLRRQAWEVGQIDYLGQDSFENIWKKIMQTLSTGPSSKPEPLQPPSETPKPAMPEVSQPPPIPQPQPSPAPEAPLAKAPSPPKAAPPPKTPSPPKAAPPPKTPSPPKAAPPPKTPSPPKAAPTPKAAPPPPIVAPSPQMPLSPESSSPVQPSAPPPTPVKPTVPSPPPAAAPAAAPAKVVAAAPPTSPPASAATKTAPPKAAAAAPEEAAKGSAPVAPKRKGAAQQQQQQQGGSGRGKSTGQKGKK